MAQRPRYMEDTKKMQMHKGNVQKSKSTLGQQETRNPYGKKISKRANVKEAFERENHGPARHLNKLAVAEFTEKQVVSTEDELKELIFDIRKRRNTIADVEIHHVNDPKLFMTFVTAVHDRRPVLTSLKLQKTGISTDIFKLLCSALLQIDQFKELHLIEDYSIGKWKPLGDLIKKSKTLRGLVLWVPTYSLKNCTEVIARAVRNPDISLARLTIVNKSRGSMCMNFLAPIVDALETNSSLVICKLPFTTTSGCPGECGTKDDDHLMGPGECKRLCKQYMDRNKHNAIVTGLEGVDMDEKTRNLIMDFLLG